jgi:hypothetical protein
MSRLITQSDAERLLAHLHPPQQETDVWWRWSTLWPLLKPKTHMLWLYWSNQLGQVLRQWQSNEQPVDDLNSASLWPYRSLKDLVICSRRRSDIGHASQKGSKHQSSSREYDFSFYPYCFYDRDSGRIDLYLVWMSLISLSVIATRIALTFTSNL